MAKNIIVIGGGFAGLSAATVLGAQGHRVTVLEGRQVLGGRAYSFRDAQTGDSVDNGQHLFMGCYHETQAFLDRIGAIERLRFQSNLAVDFISEGGRRSTLSCWPLPSPWHLLSGLVRLGTFSWADRARLVYVDRALREAAKNPQAFEHMTVEEWLIQARQSERARRNFWDLIAIATLNEDPKIASAAPFVTVLAQAFFDRRKASRIGISAVGLSDLYVQAAQKYLEERGGQVLAKSPVASLEIIGKRVSAVLLRDGQRLSADWVISAVAPVSFGKLFPENIRAQHPLFEKIEKLRFAPIISIHLWFDREISRAAFAGLLGTHIQWFFNKAKIHGPSASHKGYVSLVISGAHAFVDWTEKRLLSMAMEELRRLFPQAREAVLLRSLVIKEHQATLSPVVGSENLRPTAQSPFENLLIAGDWTRTGLPATIESACYSGHHCADLVIQKEKESVTDSAEVAYA